jgi:hypothetical protein
MHRRSAVPKNVTVMQKTSFPDGNRRNSQAMAKIAALFASESFLMLGYLSTERFDSLVKCIFKGFGLFFDKQVIARNGQFDFHDFVFVVLNIFQTQKNFCAYDAIEKLH